MDPAVYLAIMHTSHLFSDSEGALQKVSQIIAAPILTVLSIDIPIETEPSFISKKI
jgi:hypothetical protein